MAGKRKRRNKEPGNGLEPRSKRAKPETNGKPLLPLDIDKIILEPTPFVEDPAGEDRRRELFLYNLLSSESDDDRVKAANAIVASLLGGEGVSESLLDRHLEQKLFRGLASSRQGSRLGLSMVIAEIVRQLYGERGLAATRYRGLTFDRLLNTFEKAKPGGSANGQEERDYYIGQLFGLQGYVQSKVLFSNGDGAKWHVVLDQLLKLVDKKVWLRPQCGWTIIQALPQMQQKDAEETLQNIADAGMAKTPEGVGIWIAALDQFPAMKTPKSWRDPLATKNLQELPAALKDSGKDTANVPDKQEKRQKQINWTAQLHFVWDVIPAHFVRLAATGKDDHVEQFTLFWSRVVDQGFFSKSASDGQKFSGFMIFQKMFEVGCAQPFILEAIFSQNFMACLIHQSAKEDRYLHRAATKVLKAIETGVEACPKALVVVLQGLLSNNGLYNFDERAAAKTVERLLQCANASDPSVLLQTLKKVVLSNLTGTDAENRLRVYGDYISKIATLPSPSDTDEEPASIRALKELARLAYSTSDAELSSLTDKTRSQLRTRLTSAFAKLIKRPEDSPYLCETILSIDPSEIKMDDEIESGLADALGRLKKLLKPTKKKKTKKSATKQRPTEGLALLYAVAILQLYNGEPDALEILEDLQECFDKLQSKQAGDDSGTSESLIEILLSLVARPSALMRQVSQQVFAAFSSTITAGGLALLTEPLAAGEGAKGQQALFNIEDEMMEDAEEDGTVSDNDDADEDESELDSDVEIVDLEESAGGDEDEEGDDGSDDAEETHEDTDEDDDMEQLRDLEALDDALAKVLGSHRLDKDAEAESSDEDEDMSDSEMMALDDKLASVFKQRIKRAGNKNKENKNAKETVVNFKNRVLDLLDIYVHEQAGNPLAFRLLVPLLQLMRTTKTKPLASRAHDVILGLSRALRKARSNKEDRAGGGDVEEQMAILREMHGEALKDGAHGFAKAASTASLTVASSLYAVDRANGVGIDKLYHETQLAWHAGKIQVQPSFFVDWLNWCQGHVAAGGAPTAGQAS